MCHLKEAYLGRLVELLRYLEGQSGKYERILFSFRFSKWVCFFYGFLG
jgi:hypothetical protein